MAYRDSKPAADVTCHKHASATATATCARCEKAICDICLGYAGALPHCYPCGKVARRNAALARLLPLVLLVVAIVAAGIYALTRTPPYDYGEYTAGVTLLRGKVKAERCDKEATIDLGDALLAAGDHRGAIADVDAYIKKCGDWYRVHWIAYTAHKRLSEHDLAIAEADKLIAHRPEDADYRWWRGIEHEEAGHDALAIADYTETMRLNPRATGIPFNLASLLEKQGKRCDALLVVQNFLIHHPDATSDPGVQARVLRLRTGAPCPQDAER